jgi:bifunctional non-homologous end joining protein LigD
MANDVGGLVALVQMGVLEIHPWGARRDRLDRPDLLTFDLDPDAGLPWGRVAEAAHVLRGLLDHLGLASFVKTSGGKGLHVVVPIERRSGWDEAKAFSRQVAETLAEAAPNRFLAQASKAKRKGKVFVDWLRNARGATSVAAYSTRARPGAPVSMPIAWEEVDGADPAGWTVETAPAAIAARGEDPWAAMAGLRQSITAAARRRLDERRPRS